MEKQEQVCIFGGSLVALGKQRLTSKDVGRRVLPMKGVQIG